MRHDYIVYRLTAGIRAVGGADLRICQASTPNARTSMSPLVPGASSSTSRFATQPTTRRAAGNPRHPRVLGKRGSSTGAAVAFAPRTYRCDHGVDQPRRTSRLHERACSGAADRQRSCGNRMHTSRHGPRQSLTWRHPETAVCYPRDLAIGVSLSLRALLFETR